MVLGPFFRYLLQRFRRGPRHRIERILFDRIRNVQLYEQALRHRSHLRGESLIASNERLEFLGDAVLNLVVARYLYQRFPGEREGFLTALRAKLVNGRALAEIAERMNLGSLISMSDDMLHAGGRHNPSILANSLEAIIGALYLDLGVLATRRFVYRTMLENTDLEVLAAKAENHKSLLLEYVQARGWPQPTYHVVRERGPSHSPTFTVEVQVDGTPLGRGQGTSKKSAEMLAASVALQELGGQ